MKKADSPEAPAVLILAAGRGTRMKSATPKVLHQLMGRPLVEHVLAAAAYLRPAKTVLVTGYKAEEVEERVAAFSERQAEKRGFEGLARPVFVRQEEQLGTGHAVAMAKDVLAGFAGPLLIMAGDVPLISPNTLESFLMAHRTLGAHLSALTVRLDDPAAYGRVIRDDAGWLEKIVEYRDADEETRAVREINSGFYVARADLLFESIARLKTDNDQGEYYLTDVAADFRGRGLKAAAVELPESLAFEVRGINDRLELAEAQTFARARINESWLRAGVTMGDPATVHIETSVRLAQDVVLGPGVVLTGRTVVGEGAEIGPYAQLHDCRVARGGRVEGGRVCRGQDLD